jgi:hypothetical protein
MFCGMPSTRTILGAGRTAIGLGAWLAPDSTARVFGIDPERSDRFIARLFGVRDAALGAALLAAPAPAVKPLAAVGTAIDALDAVAGFDEHRRGTLSPTTAVLGPGAAVAFAVLGLLVLRDARGA